MAPYAPLSEALLGILFAASFLSVGFTPPLLLMLIALALLFALVLYDLMHQILPTSLLAPFVLVSAVYGYVQAQDLYTFGISVFVACILAGIILAIHLFSKGRAMGFADAPLVYGLALLSGAHAIAGFVFSFWIGAGIGIIMLAGRPRGSRMGIEVPFAPFLAAGFLLATFTSWDPFALASSLLRFAP